MDEGSLLFGENFRHSSLHRRPSQAAHLLGKDAPPTGTEQEDEDEGQQKRVEASRLGKILSEQTTRTVILGVLCIMLVLPMIHVSTGNLTPAFGLEKLFWFGISGCIRYQDFFIHGNRADSLMQCWDTEHANITDEKHVPWLSVEGYEYFQYSYTEQSRFQANGKITSDITHPILYMLTPDMRHNGRLRPVNHLQTNRCEGNHLNYPFSGWQEDQANTRKRACSKKCCWQVHPHCGLESATDCPWRDTETELIAFFPGKVWRVCSFRVHLRRSRRSHSIMMNQ